MAPKSLKSHFSGAKGSRCPGCHRQATNDEASDKQRERNECDPVGMERMNCSAVLQQEIQGYEPNVDARCRLVSEKYENTLEQPPCPPPPLLEIATHPSTRCTK